MALSKRTQLEQAAGREIVEQAVADELMQKGIRELKRRFPGVV